MAAAKDDDSKQGDGVELVANGTLRSDESFSHEKAEGHMLTDRDDDDMWIHGSDDLLDVRKSRRRTMFGRMHWWWLVLGMVLLGVVVTAVIIFTKDQPPYQKAIYKQQSVSEELTSDTAAPITAANETYVHAWRPDTLCSFNGTALPLGIAKPLFYNLTVYLEPDHFAAEESNALLVFDAEVAVTLEMQQSTNCLVMHSVGLNYNHIWVSDDAGKTACVCGGDYGCPTGDCWKVVKRTGESEASELVIFDLSDTPLPLGVNITLHAAYSAHFSPNLGLYRSEPFTYYGDKSSVLVVTQLEQTGARHLFPAYDQPVHKAEFQVTLQYPNDMVALSNTPAEESWAGSKDGTAMSRFGRTPEMSPYLLAVCVGVLKNQTTFSPEYLYNVVGWSTPDLSYQLQTGLQAAARALDFYHSWTSMAQPIKTFNLVAVPGKTGAMENWGLLMFDQDRFLVHPGTEGAYGEWLCADVVCHEVAHQWFGNLVTCANWAEITVNEGVATFMEYKCLEAASPKMSGGSFFQIATSPMNEWLGVHEGPRSLALSSDDDPERAALVPQLNASGVAVLQFTGRIAYSKGAALLGMLEAYWEALSPGSFQKGMANFLKEFAYGVATTDNLVDTLLEALLNADPSMDRALDLNRKGLMTMTKDEAASVLRPWFHQPGYPLLTVQDLRNDDAVPQLSFAQQRFLWAGAGIDPESPWYIPIPVGNMGFTNLSYDAPIPTDIRWSSDDEAWLEVGDATAALSGPAVPETLNVSWLANKDGLGLYRTLYGEKQMRALIARLEKLMSPPEHTNANVLQVISSNVGPLREASALLEDAFPLAYANLLDTPSVLGLYSAASKSPAANGGMGKYLLLLPVLSGISKMSSLLYNTYPCNADLDSFVVKLLTPHTDQLVTMVERSGKVGSSTEQKSQSNFLGRIIRPKVVMAASWHGDELAPQTLCRLFKMHYSKDILANTLDPDLRGAAYIVAVARPDNCDLDEEPEEAWDLMFEKWQHQPDITESRRGLFALAYARNPDRLQKTLDVVLDPKGEGTRVVEFTDRLALIRILSDNRWARDMVWPYFRDNWDALYKKYGSGVWRLLEEAGQPLVSTQADELHKFFEETAKDAPEETRSRIMGRLQHDLDWLATNKQPLCDFLINNSL